MDKIIDEVDFTIFDTETTGLDPESGDRIVEIAGIRFRGKARLGIFQKLINPQRPISPAAFQVNKISPGMLKDAPTVDIILPDFMNFIRGSILCSYNASFDLAFLNSELRLCGFKPLEGVTVADVLKMAKRLLPGMERYALWFVADKLGIRSKQEHRAFSDVELTLEVFNRLKELLNIKGIFDLANFSSLFAINQDALADINNQKTAKIQEAMDLGLKLKIKYISASSAAVTERELIPKEIRKEKNTLYLVGFCCLRNEERTFRIDSILHLEML